MPFFDLSSTTPNVDASAAVFDATSDVYLDPALQLLPRGRAWPREGLMRTLVQGLMMELSRVRRRGRDLVDEFDPRTTSEVLPDWERVLGLPECSTPTTKAARVAAVVAKLQAVLGHDQTEAFWIALAEGLGFEVKNFEIGKGPFTVLSPVTDPLNSEEWESVWEIIVNAVDDEALALLLCYVEKNASLETLPLVHVRYSIVDTGIGSDLWAVESANGYIVAVGDGGDVTISDDHGVTWGAGQILPTNGRAIAKNVNGGGWWLAGGDDGDVYRAADLGDAWVAVSSIGHTIWALDAVGAEPGALIIGTDETDPDVWSTPDDGVTLVDDLRVLEKSAYGATHDGVAWIMVGAGGVVWRSVDLGAIWTASAPAAANGDILYAAAAWLGTMIAVGVGGRIIRSVDSGATWAAVTSGTTANLRGAATNGSRWYAVGDSGTVLESEDAGQTWAPAPTPTTTITWWAATCHDGRLVAVGDGGLALTE